mmetsp:Transcript_18127/g.41461  ORF Transcript_18127/g.41461 Transcript_18127/m.41461 type:complete len:117 (+) Transcript_18127:1744-2094(+)
MLCMVTTHYQSRSTQTISRVPVHISSSQSVKASMIGVPMKVAPRVVLSCSKVLLLTQPRKFLLLLQNIVVVSIYNGLQNIRIFFFAEDDESNEIEGIIEDGSSTASSDGGETAHAS